MAGSTMATLVLVVLCALSLAHTSSAFALSGVGSSRLTGASRQQLSSRSSRSSLQMVYIPDGLSKQEYEAIKKKEQEMKKNLGAMGPNRFKSRSFSAWQAAGGKHLFPVDPKKVKSGEIALEDVPYMQRGGAWDNSDLLKGQKDRRNAKKGFGIIKEAKKVEWTKMDKEYGGGGFKKEQSISIFGGAPLPWNQRWQRNGVKDGITNGYDPEFKGKRGVTTKPMSEATRKRVEKERMELARKEAKLGAKLDAENKKDGAGGVRAPFRFW